MKYLFLSLAILFSFLAKSQTIRASLNGTNVDTIKVKEQGLVGELKINLSVDSLNGPFTISYSREEATASKNLDYELPNVFDDIINKANGDMNIFIVKILPDNIMEGTEYLNLKFSCATFRRDKFLTIMIEDDDNIPIPAKKENSILETKITYLNAFAFDFGNTKKDIEYVGHINFFSQHKSKHNRWAYNVGFMKLNYRNNDTVNSKVISTEWIARRLYDTLKENDKYRVEQNSYYQKISNRDYSVYLNPMFLLNKGSEENKNNKFFLHGYAELLISQWDIENGYRTLKVDSIEYKSILHGASQNSRPSAPILYNRISDKNSYSYKEITGNFGFGITYYSMPVKNISFFFQSTIGFNTRGVYYQSFSNRYNLVKGDERITEFANKIYLIRSMINMEVNENTEIRIGADVRGYFNVSVPKYALYIGLNIKASELLKLLK
jgi:hypothetical protein